MKISKEEQKQFIDLLTKKAMANGEGVLLGWLSFQKFVIPPSAPEVQHREMRKAFYAGAQHLFASILTILSPGADPTEEDLRYMDGLHKELQAFVDEMKKEAAANGNNQ